MSLGEAYNIEMDLGIPGKCHLCKFNNLIKFCQLCDHWFCKSCRNKFFWRGLEAVKELISGKTPGCCGPKED